MFSIKRIITDSNYRRLVFKSHGFYNCLSDEAFVRKVFKAAMGYDLNLENPVTFCEKLQWLKLYDRQDSYVQYVDKYGVRQHIAQTIGKQYLVPLLGVWNTEDEIDFSSLPDKFVLKCTHDSHNVVICKDKKNLDVAKAKRKMRRGLRSNFYLKTREWPYKLVPRKVIAEEYLEDESGTELKDYKILCFGGVPKLIQVHKGRFVGVHYQDWYDVEWNKLNMNQVDSKSSPEVMERPSFLEEALELSEKLSQGIPHVRVDWYFANQRLYFGELTFFDSSGYSPLEPREFEELLGSWITLPSVKTIK